MADLEVLIVRVTQVALAFTAASAVYAVGWLERCYRKDLPPRTDWSTE